MSDDPQRISIDALPDLIVQLGRDGSVLRLAGGRLLPEFHTAAKWPAAFRVLVRQLTRRALASRGTAEGNAIHSGRSDGHLQQIDRFMAAGLRHRSVIVANPASIEARRRESCVRKHALLRSPIHRDAFALAMSVSDAMTASGTVSAQPDGLERDTTPDAATLHADAAGTSCVPMPSAHRCENERFDLILMDLNKHTLSASA